MSNNNLDYMASIERYHANKFNSKSLEIDYFAHGAFPPNVVSSGFTTGLQCPVCAKVISANAATYINHFSGIRPSRDCKDAFAQYQHELELDAFRRQAGQDVRHQPLPTVPKRTYRKKPKQPTSTTSMDVDNSTRAATGLTPILDKMTEEFSLNEMDLNTEEDA